MELELLQKAIEENYNALSEVNNAAYSLEPVSEERLIEIAKDVNKQLGYELYDKLDKESLVADFSTTSREMYKYTLDKSKFLNDRLEKALVEHCDDILVDVVKAHENFDSMETFELYTLAFEVNEKLGYRLFRDIYSYSLKRDFERVAKAVETYKKEGKSQSLLSRKFGSSTEKLDINITKLSYNHKNKIHIKIKQINGE